MGGRTSEYKADNTGNDRYRGRSDTWKFADEADIGKFRCLHVRMAGKDGWHFQNVDISVNGEALPTVQNTVGWLDNNVNTDFCVTEPVIDPVPAWKCYNYTKKDIKWAKKNNKSESEKCERMGGRKFTAGKNENYPGCNGCSCCKPL